MHFKASPIDTPDTLPRILFRRFQSHPDQTAITFRDDDQKHVLTYSDLHRRVEELAGRLTLDMDAPVQPGDRALLLFPAGVEFIVSFLACQYAGLVPVPTCFPKPGRGMPRLDAAAIDCQPSRLIGDAATIESLDLSRLDASVGRTVMVASDDSTVTSPGANRGSDDHCVLEASLRSIADTDIAFLQYTSGSTSEPKGVMVSHRNLVANLESIRIAFGLTNPMEPDPTRVHSVFWLPPFHDMGLIGGILATLYLGGHVTLMSPREFLTRPMNWLRAISETGSSVSGAPNFAYQLSIDRISSDEAAGLDLTRWAVAFCGAEPIAAETMTRFGEHFAGSGFRADAVTPCYGLAESTLLATCKRRGAPWRFQSIRRDGVQRNEVLIANDNEPLGNVKRVVSCGPPATGTTIAIVDPDSRQQLPEHQIGEIWLRGDSVSSGYWQGSSTPTESFQATIREPSSGPITETTAGGTDSSSNSQPPAIFLRTGDLGYLSEGELYVTGRMKDVIILRGRNHYPQDIEATAKNSVDGDALQCVATALTDTDGESLALTVEVSRHLDDDALPDLVRRIRRRVIEEHEVDPRLVLLTRPAAIPVTTSGKVQRQATRKLIETQQLNERYRWTRAAIVDGILGEQLPGLPQPHRLPPREETQRQIEAWLITWMISRGGLSGEEVQTDTPFSRNGLDSLAAIELSRELEDWLGIVLPIEFAARDPTPHEMATFLTNELLDDQG